MKEEEKFVEEIKNKMNTKDLHISRIPIHTKRWFTDYANDYFCGDYGLCLKHVIDSFRGMTPIGYDEVNQRIDMIVSEIEQMKSQQPDDKNTVKMADGTERSVKRK